MVQKFVRGITVMCDIKYLNISINTINCEILQNIQKNHFRCEITEKAFHQYKNDVLMLIIVSSLCYPSQV